MSDSLAGQLSRRSALKLGAAFVAALAVPWSTSLISTDERTPLRLASALPLPGYRALPQPESLLQSAAGLDAALVPAYVAAMLIASGQAQPIRGAAGRAHDPEGRFTVPFAYRLSALRYPSGAAAPAAPSWSAAWPALDLAAGQGWSRVLIGAALLRRGHSPNDTHSGHLAQAAADLARLPARGTAQALALVDPAELGQPTGLRLPTEGVMLIEYDWVLLADRAPARQFVEAQPVAPLPRLGLPARLIPLMPLPAAARARHAAIAASLAA